MPEVTTDHPQLTGTRLAQAELSALQAITAGEQFRSTISLEGPLALAAIRAAAREKRDFSNFIAVVLEEYTAAHGTPAPEIAELFAKLTAAIETKPEIKSELERIIRGASRKGRAAA